jgi:hypothetical protein
MSKTVPLATVPKDVDDTKSVCVFNPLTTDFTHKFDGIEKTLKAGEYTTLPMPVAVHMAKHLAKRIVFAVAGEEREKVLETVEQSKRKVIEMKPYPRFDQRVGDVAKMLVFEMESKEKPKKEELLRAASEEGVKDQNKDKKKKQEDKKVVIADK